MGLGEVIRIRWGPEGGDPMTGISFLMSHEETYFPCLLSITGGYIIRSNVHSLEEGPHQNLTMWHPDLGPPASMGNNLFYRK